MSEIEVRGSTLAYIAQLELQIAADTIRLKQDTDVMLEAIDRIEALEAALRKIADSQFTGETAWRQSAKIALAALAPEQDK